MVKNPLAKAVIVATKAALFFDNIIFRN